MGFKEKSFHSSFCPRRVNAGVKGRHLPGVPSQGSVMESVEAVIISDGDISTRLQKHREHVVSLLANGVMQGGITFRILK